MSLGDVWAAQYVSEHTVSSREKSIIRLLCVCPTSIGSAMTTFRPNGVGA